MELLEYEKRHIDYVSENAHECTLFLNRNDAFPIKEPCRVALYGSGARRTIKGGTGSGDVSSRMFLTCEQGLEQAGFIITTKEWLDNYDAFKKSTHKEHVKHVKKEAHKRHALAVAFSMGYAEEEKNYDLPLDYESDIAVYVVGRNSGEGNDRRNIEGDVKLSKTEVRDILALNKKYEHFLLVLNVGGVIDLTPVLEVNNILLLSQLGVPTGMTLANIILGKANPSGKLSTTWSKPEDNLTFNEFGDMYDTYYKEGIYVGYRYYDTVNKEVYYPFGYGLSYTSFELSPIAITNNKSAITIQTKVRNTGSMSGKEVVQVYLSAPTNKLDKPYQSLVGFQKTKELQPNEEEVVSISFNLKDNASYDVETARYILECGKYIVRVGNSSRNTQIIGVINLNEEIIVSQLANKCGKPSFKDFTPTKVERNEELSQFTTIELNMADFDYATIEYHQDEYVDSEIEKLTNEELAYLCCGQFGKGIAGIVGDSGENVIGGAGETTKNVPSITKRLTMADGPAGLRLLQEYGKDEKGTYPIVPDPIMVSMSEYLPKFLRWILVPNNSKRHGEVHHQYTTAIPIGTALAQSFNTEFVYALGKIVQEEMELFNVDLWLAPALNIHRNILCGRNFEYYSEDPLLSGEMAATITRGVQNNSKRGTTIKHFACNNQELNRFNNNSHLSERALREIYLKGFEICIKESNPLALMTSYNLINGVHASESYDLLNDILRCEWGYKGLVMSDWVTSGQKFASHQKHPCSYASIKIKAGNDLCMPGGKVDIKDISKALKKNKITREDLIRSASRIYRSINIQK